jgi:hypothetical protein
VSWRNELVTRTEKGEDGDPVMVLMPRLTIVDADKISHEAAAAVAEVSQTVNGALRVKLHDKHAAYDPKRTNTGSKSRSAAVSSLACYPLHEPARLNRIQNISGFPQGPAQPFGGTLIVR